MDRPTLHEAKRLKQIKKHLLDNRKTITEESLSNTFNVLSKELYGLGFTHGYKFRNHIYRKAATQRRIRMRKDWDHFYDEQISMPKGVNNVKSLTIGQLEQIEKVFRDWM